MPVLLFHVLVIHLNLGFLSKEGEIEKKSLLILDIRHKTEPETHQSI